MDQNRKNNDVEMDEEKSCLLPNKSGLHAYKIRWLFLVVLMIVQAINSYTFCSFGQVSNFYHHYFNISYAEVDWLTLSGAAVMTIGTPFLAWLCHRRLINLKKMICFGACFVRRNLVSFVILGQLTNGFAAALLVAVPPAFAVTWFPNHQIGTAMSLVLLGISVGSSLGYVVPANVLIFPSDASNVTSYTETWAEENRRTVLTMNLTLTGLALLASLLFLFLLPYRPARPPNLAEAERWKTNDQGPIIETSFFQQVKKLTTPTFLLLNSAFGISFHVNTMEITLMPQILRTLYGGSSTSLNSDVRSGIVMFPLALGGAIGCLIGGKVLDVFHRPKLQALFGTAMCIVTTTGLVLGYVFQVYWLLVLSNGLYGVSIRMCVIPFFKMAIEHAYPMDEIVVSLCLVGAQAAIGVLSAEIARLTYIYASALWTLITQTVWFVVAFALTLLADPTFQRQIVENNVRGN